MKNITEYIAESMITESVRLYKMTAQNAQYVAKVIDAIKNYLRHSKKRYSFNNATDVKQFYADVCKFSKLDPSTLKKANVPDGKTMVAPIIQNKEALEHEGWKFAAIKSFDETETQKEYKAWKKSDDYVPAKQLDKNDYKDADEEELKRTLVIYYYANPGDPETTLLYPYSGTRKGNDHQAHMASYDWHIETGLNYYDARQILLSNYLKKSDADLKKRDVVIDNDDL